MLLQIKTVCTTIHIVPLVWIVGANATRVEPMTPKFSNLGQVFQKNIIHKIRSIIFLELSKDTKLEKCLHGKTQSANNSYKVQSGNVLQKVLFLCYLI